MDLNQYKITSQEREANGVVSAPDTLTGTARQNKSVFDRLVGFFVDKYNNALNVLQSAGTNAEWHIASRENPHGVTKAQVGLGNADNTSDAAKPVSVAVQERLAQVDAYAAQTRTTANSALSLAQSANGKADAAGATASSALFLAQSASGKADAASGKADAAGATASTAIATANEAKTTAATAYTIAYGIAKTAQDALATAQQARTLAESVALVYDPVTGHLVPVAAALQSIYDLVKASPMTAQDFASNTITVEFFRNKNMTVTEFATRGKQILIGG